MALTFDNKTCTRCGGGGMYGPSVVYGGKCFQCSGLGATLTKRGRAAQVYLESLRRVPAADLQPGDEVLVEGFSAGSVTVPSRWVKVVEVTPDGAVRGEGMTWEAGCRPLRKAWRADEKREQVQMALAYQATLTLAGTVRKRS